MADLEGADYVKDKMKKVLCELLKDSGRSDRELAKKLGVSQPTVSRLRNKLMNEGVIKQFSVVPDLKALGFELIAVTSFTSKISDEMTERAIKWTKAKPSVLFAAGAEGTGRNFLMISVHRNYTEYHNFISEAKNEAGGLATGYDTMLISLEDTIVKPFSLAYIAELLKESKD